MHADRRLVRFSEQDRRATLLATFVLAMLTLVGTVFLADELTENHERKGLLGAVSQSSGVALDGRPLADPSTLLVALRGLKAVPAHHSSPGTPIHLALTGGQHAVEITIARDSERPNEFWVYRPGRNWHNDPMGSYAGGIVSDDLSRFLMSRGL